MTFFMFHTNKETKEIFKSWVIPILSIVTLVFTASYFVGKDYNWDLLNYHYWSGYRLIHGGIDFDIAAGNVQSWMNPASYLGIFLAIESLPPLLAGLVLSIPSVLALLFSFRICYDFIDTEPNRNFELATMAAAIGFTGVIFVSLIGTTFNDAFNGFIYLFSILGNFATTNFFLKK